MNFDEASIDKKSSFIYFVYPFLFDTKEFETRVKRIETARLSEQEEQTLWDMQQFPKDDLLSHVADYLNPNNTKLPTARLWKINDAFRDVFGFRNEWILISPSGKVPFHFGLDNQGSKALQLALFRVGVGFLTVLAQPMGTEVSNWLDFLHYFRFIRGQRGVKIKAKRRIFDQETQQQQYIDFFPEPAGGITEHPDGIGFLGELVNALLNTGTNINKRNLQPWWKEVFVPGQMLPFAGLFMNGLPQDKQPYLLYKLRNFFNSSQGDHPSLFDLDPNHPANLPYVENQWFITSLEGTIFQASDSPDTEFFRQTLPVHLRNEYFLLFLLALHQRFALMMLSAKVAENWLIDNDNSNHNDREKLFTNIRDQLLSFTARGYFTQAMQREHHHRCYLKWQEAFQVERLYREVNDEVREMHEYSLMQQTQRVEERINLVGAFIGIPALVISFLGINLRGINAGSDGMPLLWALLIAFGLGLGLSLLVWQWLRK